MNVDIGRVLSPVTGMLDNVGVEYEFDGDTIRCVQGVVIAAEAERVGGSKYRSGSCTGRFVILVDSKSSSRPTRFPPLTSGGHSIQKIVAKVVGLLAEKKRELELAQIQMKLKLDGAALVKDLTAELKLPANLLTNSYWYDNRYSNKSREVIAPAGKVIVQLGNKTYNAEQVRVLAKALEEIEALKN